MSMIIEPVPWRVRKTPLHQDWIKLDQTDGRPNSTRITDFIIFACMAFSVDVPGLGLPLNEVAPLVGLTIAYTRRPLPGAKVPNWFWGWLLAWIGWLIVQTYLMQAMATELYPGMVYKRLAHLIMDALLMMAVATGRFDLRSASQGLLASLSLGVMWALYDLPQSSYAGRLTGYLGDPNGAGLVLAMGGMLAMPRLTTRRWQVLLGGAILIGIVATLSRTSIMATAVGLLWLALARRVSGRVGYLVLAAIAFGISRIPADAVVLGPFEARTGSDELRADIDAAARLLADQNPLTGNGVGSIFVKVRGDYWFFHNTYDLMRSEGGWIALILYLILCGLVFFKLTSLPKVQRNGWVESSMVIAFICGLNLGDVLCNTVFAVALGMAMRHWLNCQAFKPEEGQKAVAVEFR